MKKNKKKYTQIIVFALTIISLITIIILFFGFWKNKNFFSDKKGDETSQNFQGVVINDEIKIPDTKNIPLNAGEIVLRGDYDIKLQPTSDLEKVLVVKAKLTLKEAYKIAETSARAWSSDVRLVFIRSNGALNLDGRSSSWQIVFASERFGSGYEIIISEDKIINTRILPSEILGYDLPENWYDSDEAISSLFSMPQFSDSYLSALNFYYSVSAESWAYALALTDDKTVSMWVK